MRNIKFQTKKGKRILGRVGNTTIHCYPEDYILNKSLYEVFK